MCVIATAVSGALLLWHVYYCHCCCMHVIGAVVTCVLMLLLLLTAVVTCVLMLLLLQAY